MLFGNLRKASYVLQGISLNVVFEELFLSNFILSQLVKPLFILGG